MASVKLCTILCVLSMCMALDCNWRTHYEYKGKCETCPSGEFPVHQCTENHLSACEKCTEKGDHCFCNNTLCANDKCSQCSSIPRCKPGEQLRRTGLFKFTYICEPCLNQTYYDEEDKMCKPILDCRKLGLHVLFPGNRTHDARCGCPDINNHNGLVVCLAISFSVCLAMLIFLCIQRTREQKTMKNHFPTSCSLKAPPDEWSSYKLSKEEMGEQSA